jgi:hypothetical protein
MSDRDTTDPENTRGGVAEAEDAKGGAPGGIVPRDLVDEDTSPADGEHDMSDEALGSFDAAPDPSVQVPRDGGDNADATRDGGPDPDSPSRTGAGSVPQSGQSENFW